VTAWPRASPVRLRVRTMPEAVAWWQIRR